MTEPRIHAPELDGGLEWLNVERPLRLAELRGCVVVLDFWTYCCVNCMHVLPTLRALEKRHEKDPFVVIGVHSGKFGAERDPKRIRDAIERYDVVHPVVADDEMAIWSKYAIRSWPTLVVVRPDGTIAAVAPGEPELDVLDAFVERELELARKAGILAAGPPALPLSSRRAQDPLRYPGKVTASPDGARLAVSDSGHHRVLVTTLAGEVVRVIGSGMRGLADGPFEGAAFDDPQGTAWHEGGLYVADARNHAIRRIDLERGLVSTVAGTGALGRAAPAGRAPGRETALRSPWDLCAVGDALYVAMAGNHQIWRFWPASGEIEVYAGTGVESLEDGKLGNSTWAQPSGLAHRPAKDGGPGTLYVADSETSAVRAIDLVKGEVRTLVGQGLFDFGDDDGSAAEALLQHGLGVAPVEGGVLVADTYNGKLRLVTEPTTFSYGPNGEVSTVLSGLSEPGSVGVLADGSWLVADTNAHRILRVVESSGARVAQEIAIRGAPSARVGSLAEVAPRASESVAVDGWFTSLLTLPEGVGLAPGKGAIALTLRAPAGLELSEGAPIRLALEVSRRSDLLILEVDRIALDAIGGTTQRVVIGVTVASELPAEVVEAEMVATIDYVTCDATESAACFPGRAHVRIPTRLLASAGSARLELAVPLSAQSLPPPPLKG